MQPIRLVYLRAIASMLPEGSRNPFPVICGTSAGAINAASLAVSARNYHEGVRQLVGVWGNFHVDQVYRSDPIGVLYNSIRLLSSLVLNKAWRNISSGWITSNGIT